MRAILETRFAVAWSLAVAAGPVTAQVCPDFGSHRRAATITASPTVLGCSAAPTWPAWHLFTPAHREPGPHRGFDPGHAVELPRILIAYRCTGFFLLPVVPERIVTMGYVVDQSEVACVSR